MKILFIYSFSFEVPSKNKPINPDHSQIGISYISSLLKEHGHQTKLLALPRIFGDNFRDNIDSRIYDFKPKLICFTAVSTEFPFISSVAAYIKKQYPDIYLLAGGVHVSLNPERVLDNTFDALCIGEGEYPALELVSQLEMGSTPTSIENLWIKHGSEIEKNTARQFVQDIDSLPFPDREMWLEWTDDKLLNQKNLRYTVLLGRGCPFQCAYCSNHALKKIAPGPYVRFRSPNNIVEEIKTLCEKFPLTSEIYLEIETIGANKKWAMELCATLEKYNSTLTSPLAYGVNLRITPNDNLETLFEAFKKCNISFVNIGLESGSEKIRREVLKRNYSNQDVISAVQLARKFGIKVCFFNLVGLPGETVEDFNETIKMNRICLPDWFQLSIFYPYQGTDLYKLCIDKGYIKEDMETKWERRVAVLDYPEFSKKQIQRCFYWFDYYVYRGHKPTLALIGTALYRATQYRPILFIFFKIVNRTISLLGIRYLVKKLHALNKKND
ncbi:MAG: B12-binding domain-containing radical SAM protein [Candidatus Latescibacteria bacterium]|nr:B12-binding domain-containing radical SAM protein [Candidatus Latescibacterota bacterium]